MLPVQMVLKPLNLISLTHLLLFLCVFLAAGFSQDVLLFISDPYSIAVYLSGLSLVPLVFLALPLALLSIKVSSSRLDGWVRVLSSLLFALIVFTALMQWLDTDVVFNFTLDNLRDLLGLGSKLMAFCLVSALIFALCLGFSIWVSRRVQLSDRLLMLSRVSLAASVVVVSLSALPPLLSAGSKESSQPNMILLILDGLSPKYLEPYNPKEKTPDFNAVSERSLRYTNIRTNFAYTYDYFRVLYAGNKLDRGAETVKPVNLLSLLQDAGVNTRWVSYHNNGVPDIQRYSYKGLRSFYLVQKLAWFPRMLGVDYNVFRLDGGGWRGTYYSYREAILKQWLVELRGSPNYFPLETSLPKEVESLRRDDRPFFALFHLPAFAFTGADKKMKLWELEKRKVASDDTLNRIKKHMLLKQDWMAYSEKDHEALKVFGEEYRQEVRRGTKSLRKFVERFFDKEWDRDTLLIVTADHGQIFSEGKFGYGFHNDEEVARVPFLVFWKGRTGIDDRMGETIDLTQTILEFFQVPEKLAPDALSLLGPERKEKVTMLSRHSGYRHEWLMNLYQNDRRYVVNLRPGDFSVRKERFTGYFDTVVEKEGESVLAELNPDLPTVVSQYGIPRDQVDPRVWK